MLPLFHIQSRFKSNFIVNFVITLAINRLKFKRIFMLTCISRKPSNVWHDIVIFSLRFVLRGSSDSLTRGKANTGEKDDALHNLITPSQGPYQTCP